jgi:hypothetical protein
MRLRKTAHPGVQQDLCPQITARIYHRASVTHAPQSDAIAAARYANLPNYDGFIAL